MPTSTAAPHLTIHDPDSDMVAAVAAADAGATPPPVDPDHSATFRDLRGRVFTLRLPYSKFLRLREELGVDFREATVAAELPRVLRDTEALYNVVSLLVSDQLTTHGLVRGYAESDASSQPCWQDDMFGCDDMDAEGPLEQAGRALTRVVAGFIRSRPMRTALLKAIDKEQQSLRAAIELNLSELDSATDQEIAQAMHLATTGGLTVLERINAALSSDSSGSVPGDSASDRGTTRSAS